MTNPSEHGLSAQFEATIDNFTVELALSIRAGETIALLGPNGSGKSTTLSVLAGLIRPTAGEIRLGDVVLNNVTADVHVPTAARNIGILFQDYLLFDHLTVRDNIAYGPRAKGASRSVAREKVTTWLEKLDLDSLADLKPNQLSGGQAQRVALARALAGDPAMLCLDEPFAATDVTTTVALRRTLKAHLEQFDQPTLLITHDPADAFLLADRIVIIENGRAVQSGTAQELGRNPNSRFVADMAGSNLLSGHYRDGAVTVEGFDEPIRASSELEDGPVFVTISPSAIALHTEPPSGSPRNTWETRIEGLQPLGRFVRVHLGQPLPLLADITPASVETMGLVPQKRVWAAVKATEISLTAA